jgi:hypothetical protein
LERAPLEPHDPDIHRAYDEPYRRYRALYPALKQHQMTERL